MSVSSRPVWYTQRALDQPGLRGKIVYLTKPNQGKGRTENSQVNNEEQKNN